MKKLINLRENQFFFYLVIGVFALLFFSFLIFPFALNPFYLISLIFLVPFFGDLGTLFILFIALVISLLYFREINLHRKWNLNYLGMILTFTFFITLITSITIPSSTDSFEESISISEVFVDLWSISYKNKWTISGYNFIDSSMHGLIPSLLFWTFGAWISPIIPIIIFSLSTIFFSFTSFSYFNNILFGFGNDKINNIEDDKKNDILKSKKK